MMNPSPPLRVVLAKVGLDGHDRGIKEYSGVSAMSIALQIKTKVLPGHRIEIATPERPEGRAATIFVVLEEEELPKRRLWDVLKDYPGGQLFRSAEQADAYLRAERDSWE